MSEMVSSQSGILNWNIASPIAWEMCCDPQFIRTLISKESNFYLIIMASQRFFYDRCIK